MGGTFDCTSQPVKILKLLLQETFLYQRVIERLGSECLGCNQANGIIILFKGCKSYEEGKWHIILSYLSFLLEPFSLLFSLLSYSGQVKI